MSQDNQKNIVLKYVGIVMFFVGFFLAVILMHYSGSDCFSENLFMTAATIIAAGIGISGNFLVSVIIAAVSTISFAGFKIYSMMVGTGNFEFISFLWIIIPALCTFGMYLYATCYRNMDLENAVLKQQIEELVMVDRITGLYNLRSMFMDMQTQISYSERNNTPVSLMIIRLRYPAEMRKVLKREQYEEVLNRMASILLETVRLEDRVYSIDNMGGFGIILTCDEEGTKLVENRIRAKFSDPNSFNKISDKRKIRAEIKIGYLEYSKDKYNRDADSFKNDVEEEVEYDVD